MSLTVAFVTVIFVVVGALVVFAIAAVLIGGETFRLRHTPETAIFDLDLAVVSVAENLTDATAAGLTMDELRDLIRFGLDHLHAKGLSWLPGERIEAQTAPVVVAEDDAVAVVLGRADEAGLAVTDEAVVEVLDLLLAHLAEIGAVGPRAE